jgi:hypothetical protein
MLLIVVHTEGRSFEVVINGRERCEWFGAIQCHGSVLYSKLCVYTLGTNE